jgi:hypothetical protein
MRQGHRTAQDQFLALGERHGYVTRRTYSRRFPSDGVWLTPPGHGDGLAGLPVVALEVVVSESPKTILGSIGVLEQIAPALGVILLHEDEITRRLIRDGHSRAAVSRYLDRAQDRIDTHISSSRHRIERWSAEYLESLYNCSMAA